MNVLNSVEMYLLTLHRLTEFVFMYLLVGIPGYRTTFSVEFILAQISFSTKGPLSE